jgi:hypothetical protein
MSATPIVSRTREAFFTQSALDTAPDWCPLASEIAQSGYTVGVATTVHAVEALRSTWTKWAHSLDTDIDYYLHTLTHDPAVLRPCVITVYNDGARMAMLVGQISRRRASAIVSFVNIPGPSVRVLEIKKGGRMGQPSPAVDKLLAQQLLKVTKGGEVDSICFERMTLHSGLFHEIQRLPGLLIKERVPHVFCYLVLPLAAQESKRPRVFSGKVHREVRRKTRILERAFPDQVSLKCFSQPGELETGLCDAMRVAVTTWQYYLGVGLTESTQTRERLRFLAQCGWLRIYILYLKGTPYAFLIGQLYNSTFYCQYAGYNPNYTRFSVGCVLTARAFEDLAAAGVQRIDLGEGGQEHNRRLGCKISEEGTVHVYSPTLSGVCLNLFFGTAHVVRKGGRRTQSALKLNRLSRAWREYLLSRWQSRQPVDNPAAHVDTKTGRKHV